MHLSLKPVASEAGSLEQPEAAQTRSSDASRPQQRWPRLSPRAAFYLQASLSISFLAGSSAPSPLYPVYQAAWGFGPITITIVFGIYALAVLTALLTVGSLSDYVGRRPVLLIATVAQALTMLIFANASSVPELILARVVQGISTGCALGAIGAGLLDLNRQKGTLANAIAPMTGTAAGGIASGLVVQYLPAPTQLIYLALGVVFVTQAIGLVFMAESAQRKPGALAALRPHFQLPKAVRQPLLLSIPALVAVWSLVGFYGSLGPSLVRRLVGAPSIMLGGLSLFVLAGSGALTVPYTQTRTARSVMLFGTATLALGVAITLQAISETSLTTFFIGTAVAGIGFGAAFQGAIRNTIEHTAPQERAGVLSILYTVAYLAMGLPAVLAGISVVRTDLITTAQYYGLTVIVLAITALLGTAVKRPQPAAAVTISAP
jgi:MFS family permease